MQQPLQKSSQQPLLQRFFWPLLGLLWLLSTALDRLWLQLDQRLPAWDQADYLNSALDHGRALGLLPGGHWQGWQALLDLSPKIPPLASLVNGSVMAVAGDSPDQAAWALSLWHGLLLLGVALWGRQLGGMRRGAALGLLAALLCGLMPLLAEVRVDYVLEIPLGAACTWALWLLGRWQRPAPLGGHWPQALGAALAVASALLIKQSALLVLVAPALWAAAAGLRQGQGRRPQVLAALALVLALVLPWLQHNLITTLGGTERATLESAAREGDPNASSLAGWLWYPRRLPQLVGAMPLVGALLGALVGAGQLARRGWPYPRWQWPSWQWPSRDWGWLLGGLAAGSLLTVLSPNKDSRYLAPLLPLLALALARCWLLLPWPLLAAGLVASAGLTGASRGAAIERQGHPAEPLEAIVASLQGADGASPRTLIVVPSTGGLNQHNVSYYGRRGGGQLVGRQLGGDPSHIPAALAQAQLVLLGSGFQGSVAPQVEAFNSAIRQSGRFSLRQSWPKPLGGRFELWVRRPQAPLGPSFSQRFPPLAAGLAQGPAGLAPLFDAIGVEHQLDGHLLYQGRVRQQALTRLASNPNDPQALWSLGLLAVLQNRPLEADRWFARLETLNPASPWPSAYRAVVLNAAWRPWQARAVADLGQRRSPNPVLRGLGDLSGVLGGQLWRIGSARQSIPAARRAVEAALKPKAGPDG